MQLTGIVKVLAVAVCCGGILVGCSSGSSTTTTTTATNSSVALVAGGSPGKTGYLVYWDQNEEVDFLHMPSGVQGQLLPAWDLNGQVCILPDGRFVGGVDPTLPAQDNLGSAKPYKQPADGEELDEPNGSFSGQELYVPGPYKMPGQSIGSDSPPTSNGVFNNNQTYTGCVIDKSGNILANDIATAQGDYPPPSSGRLVEWFAPNYTTYCIDYGPTSGGTGPHHTDGSGGLAQPGNDGAGRQRRRARAQRRHLQRAPIRRIVVAHQRFRMPRGDLPAQQGAGVQFRERRVVSRRCGQGPDLQLLRRQQLHR